MLILITGPVAAGKSTLARAVADHLQPAAAIDLDLVYGFARRRPGFDDRLVWSLARRGARAMADEFLAQGLRAVVVEGDVHSAEDLEEVAAAHTAIFVTLDVSYDVALTRATDDPDPDRVMSRRPDVLRMLHDEFALAMPYLRTHTHVLQADDVPPDDLADEVIALARTAGGGRIAGEVDAELVRTLIAGRFPQWAHLPIRPCEPGGWDNRTFHLGDSMSVRLPRSGAYAAQVDKEHRWLPHLRDGLPLPIPTPMAKGEPAAGYPWSWSVYQWIEGETAITADLGDEVGFARDLARFLTDLHRIPVDDGPPPGPHNFFRGGPLSVYDGETRAALTSLAGVIDTSAAADIWQEALDAKWDHPPVWVHGDIAPGNLLVTDGTLSAVIDFGCMAVGDPACDLVMAWTFFPGASQQAFRAALDLDDGTWARARGWALWKALIVLAQVRESDPASADEQRRAIDHLLARPLASRGDDTRDAMRPT